MGFLPSVRLLFPPGDDSYRKAALSTTWDLGERCKDPQRVGRAPADNTFWVGVSDPILTLSQLRGSEDFQPQNFLDIIYAIFSCVLVHF